MSPIWALQDAKNSFSKVVARASDDTPQIVTKRGTPAVVVISWRAYRDKFEKKPSLLEALRRCPGGSDDLDFSRDHDMGRKVSL